MEEDSSSEEIIDPIKIYPNEPFLMSKIFITGPLTPLMPYIVLKELALECGILVSMEKIKNPVYYAKIYSKIAKFTPPILLDIELQKDKVIDFVNPLVEWNTPVLRKATHFLYQSYSIYKKENNPSINIYSSVGLSTPESPYLLNACILFGLSRRMDLKLSLEISYDELQNILIENMNPRPISFIDSVEILNESTSCSISTETESDERETESDEREQEVDINQDGEQDSEQGEERDGFEFFKSYEELKVVGNLFQDVGYLQNNFHPITDAQAVVAGAIVYLTDLSVFCRPLVEFNQIKKGKKFKNKIWNKFQTNNPNILDLNLYFNPYFPDYFYMKETFEHHLSLFSFPTYEFIGMTQYEILQELFLKDNFHIGWHPNISSKETPIFLETVDDLSMEEILVYGSLYENNLCFTTWRELNEIFRKTGSFTNPFELKSILDSHKVHRLVKLGNFILNPSFDYQYLFQKFTIETKQQIKECLEVIEDIFFEQRIESEGFLEYKNVYEQSPMQLKNIYRDCLEQLFRVCMSMRGWSGNQSDPYPIEVVPFRDNDETEKNTIESIFELDEWNEKTMGVFYDFPLMLWKNEFTKSGLEEQGLTIGKRIEMVKNGENSTISSCIRMTSNVLGASYCFYCKLFGIDPKFKIENLRHIQ